MQYTEMFIAVKIENFVGKILIFLIFLFESGVQGVYISWTCYPDTIFVTVTHDAKNIGHKLRNKITYLYLVPCAKTNISGGNINMAVSLATQLIDELHHGKPDFCLCENKGANQLCSNCTADQRLCFRYTNLLPKSEISNF